MSGVTIFVPASVTPRYTPTQGHSRLRLHFPKEPSGNGPIGWGCIPMGILVLCRICSVLASPLPLFVPKIFSFFEPCSIPRPEERFLHCLLPKNHKKNTCSPLLGTIGRETGRGLQKWLKPHTGIRHYATEQMLSLQEGVLFLRVKGGAHLKEMSPSSTKTAVRRIILRYCGCLDPSPTGICSEKLSLRADVPIPMLKNDLWSFHCCAPGFDSRCRILVDSR